LFYSYLLAFSCQRSVFSVQRSVYQPWLAFSLPTVVGVQFTNRGWRSVVSLPTVVGVQLSVRSGGSVWDAFGLI
jgi:hypothetical protein